MDSKISGFGAYLLDPEEIIKRYTRYVKTVQKLSNNLSLDR